MMEEREDGFQWTCDGCGAVAEFASADFWSAWGELKARGWSATRIDDGWTHDCPRCSRPKGSVLDLPLAGGMRKEA